MAYYDGNPENAVRMVLGKLTPAEFVTLPLKEHQRIYARHYYTLRTPLVCDLIGWASSF
jgi:hypothetical protein